MSPNFLLFDGGPFFELQRRLRLMQPEHRGVGRRIVTVVLITWVPMALLALTQGFAIGTGPRESMLLDIAMYARFVVALPLLILTEVIWRPRLRAVVHHFLDAGLVAEPEQNRFQAFIYSALKLRDSRTAELLFLVMAYGHTWLVVEGILGGVPSSWRAIAPGIRNLTLAGWWYAIVGMPLYAFVLYRFAYRMFLWWRLMWQTSRLTLRLNASHPDGAGGLGFLRLVIPPFAIPAFAIAVATAAGTGDLISFEVTSFQAITAAILVFVVFQIAVLAGPFAFFIPQLAESKRRGILSYGVLSGQQLRLFEQSWLGNTASGVPGLLKEQDFSAVTDYNQMVAIVHEMRIIPFRWLDVVPLVLASSLPFLLVVAQEVSLGPILLKLLMALL